MKSFASAIVALGLVTAAPAFAAPTLLGNFTGANADTNYLNFLTGQGINTAVPTSYEVAVAQARGGDSGGAATYEAGLHIPPSFTSAAPIGTAGQINWGTVNNTNNPWIAFTISRTGNQLRMQMGSYDQTYTNADVALINEIGIRIRSDAGANFLNNSTGMRNLKIDGVALPIDTMFAQNGDVQILLFGNIAGNFSMTGETQLRWTNTFPSQSRLGFQVKLIKAPEQVSEPATFALLGAGLLGLAAIRRRKA
jgi:hypothetical protein